MSTIVFFNGTARTFPDDFMGTEYAAIWESFFNDLGQDLRYLRAIGATSATPFTIAASGAIALDTPAAINLPAGLYRVQSLAGWATDTAFMVVDVTTAMVASTAFAGTIRGKVGTGTNLTDWVIFPVWGTARRAIKSKVGAYSVVITDDKALIDCTGTFTVSLDAIATLGLGFEVGIRSATGTITVDPDGAETANGAATLSVTAGQAIEITPVSATNWGITSASGYGGLTRARLHAAVYGA